jgi:hypothetical protein
MMSILISIDDTDNPDSQGTGRLSQSLSRTIQEKGWGLCSAVTRHQLFVHEDIPYTSHNSAMCFEADIDDAALQPLTDFMQEALEQQSAEGSDPGLCIAVRDRNLGRRQLMAFGQKAKNNVLTKSQAYDLAGELGIHLSEHGGTGDGIIGALAGIGLRLTGNDGRFRGWYHFDKAGTAVSVKELCQYPFVDEVRPMGHPPLSPEQKVILGDDKVKIIFLDGCQVLPVAPNGVNGSLTWVTLSKERIKILWP